MQETISRRLEEKERRREEILDAAERVFLSKGYESAKMEDIARSARVSRALLYVYFKDKSELQFGICLRGLTLLRERFLAAASPSLSGLEQVRAIGHAYIGFAQAFPVYFAAMTRFETHTPELQDETSLEHRLMLAGRAVHEVTVSALLCGQRDGSLRPDLGDPLLVAISLWGFTHGVILLAQTKGAMFDHLGYSTDGFLDSALELGLRGLRSA